MPPSTPNAIGLSALSAMSQDPLAGKYTLLAKLATGGMSEIFVARMQGIAGFHKPVVIKRIHPHVAHDQEFVQMFLDEAVTTSRITHPNVCQVLELCRGRGANFLVLEYLEGVPVSALLQRCLSSGKPLDMRLAAGIIAQAAEGLHAAHEQLDDSGRAANLVHRDVSPANLFVTTSGVVKVLDFGIAKARWVSRRTRAGTLLGKCEYMSPEQARGGQALDRRSDIFSLGIVLYELLIGRRLFNRDNNYKTLRAVLRDHIKSPRKVRPALPRRLEAVTMRALTRDRDRRYASADLFRQAITNAMRFKDGPMPPHQIGPLIQRAFASELTRQRILLCNAASDDRTRTLSRVRIPEAGHTPDPLSSLPTPRYPSPAPVATQILDTNRHRRRSKAATAQLAERTRRLRRYERRWLASVGLVTILGVGMTTWFVRGRRQLPATSPARATSNLADSAADAVGHLGPVADNVAHAVVTPLDTNVVPPGMVTIRSPSTAQVYRLPRTGPRASILVGPTPIYELVLPAGEHEFIAIYDQTDSQRFRVFVESNTTTVFFLGR